jgi:predicted CxxxxCH...CXXCH cytochrome family protein
MSGRTRMCESQNTHLEEVIGCPDNNAEMQSRIQLGVNDLRVSTAIIGGILVIVTVASSNPGEVNDLCVSTAMVGFSSIMTVGNNLCSVVYCHSTGEIGGEATRVQGDGAVQIMPKAWEKSVVNLNTATISQFSSMAQPWVAQRRTSKVQLSQP